MEIVTTKLFINRPRAQSRHPQAAPAPHPAVLPAQEVNPVPLILKIRVVQQPVKKHQTLIA